MEMMEQVARNTIGNPRNQAKNKGSRTGEKIPLKFNYLIIYLLINYSPSKLTCCGLFTGLLNVSLKSQFFLYFLSVIL